MIEKDNAKKETETHKMYSRISSQGDEKEEEDVPELPVDSIYVIIPARKPFSVPFFDGQTVGELKKTISGMLASTPTPLPAHMQRLAFNGRVLTDDDVTLHHVGIHSDSQIHCFPRPNGTPTIPLATVSSTGSNNAPIVIDVVQDSNNRSHVNTDGQRSEALRRRGLAYHVLIQRSFKVRLFALIMLFFYGFGLVSNIAFWMGDKAVPDDREIVPGEEPHELSGPISTLDFISNFTGILAALLGLRAIREQSLPIAQRYVRMTILLVFFSIIQLSMEAYAFSDRYQKNSPSASARHGGSSGSGSGSGGSSPVASHTSPSPFGGGSSTSTSSHGRVGSQKDWDDLMFTVAINFLVRGIFWSLLLNTAKRYLQAFVDVQRVNSERSQVPDLGIVADGRQTVAHGTPVVGMVEAV